MANYNEVMDMNARSKKGAKPMLSSIEHAKSANGGHVFTHRFMSDGAFHEPETHTFGADEGKQALAHFAQHAGLSEVKPDPDSAAGTAT